MLALTHFSTRYPVGLLRDEARAIFAPTVLPRDFDTIEIPFSENAASPSSSAGARARRALDGPQEAEEPATAS